MGSTSHSAYNARRESEEKGGKRFVQIDALLGAGHRSLFESTTKKISDLEKAEEYINNALSRCKRITLTTEEATIMLELARIKRLQFNFKDSYNIAQDALKIADRCKYRLQQADIHLFLAQLALDGKEKISALTEVNMAIERASCGYKPTYLKAKKLKRSI